MLRSIDRHATMGKIYIRRCGLSHLGSLGQLSIIASEILIKDWAFRLSTPGVDVTRRRACFPCPEDLLPP